MFTSAADAARKQAAAHYDKSHNAFNETRDTPPAAPDPCSPHLDEDEDDDYEDYG